MDSHFQLEQLIAKTNSKINAKINSKIHSLCSLLVLLVAEWKLKRMWAGAGENRSTKVLLLLQAEAQLNFQMLI